MDEHTAHDGVYLIDAKDVDAYQNAYIPELLNLVDERKMALRTAVELSYLPKELQKSIYNQIVNRECMPSHAQTIRMRRLSEHGQLNDATIITIMKEDKLTRLKRYISHTTRSESIFPRALHTRRPENLLRRL